MAAAAHTLDALTENASTLEPVRKNELHSGDWVLVRTKNSLYSICCLGSDQYVISGGWFDREGVSPARVSINGCTWGGTAIKADVIAARGLFLEFGNQVVTTRIQNVRVIRGRAQQFPN